MSDELCKQFESECGTTGGVKKKTMTGKEVTKWFKGAKIFGKDLTTTDTDIAFSKVKQKGKSEITYSELNQLLKEIAPKYKKDKKLKSDEEALEKMKEAVSKAGHDTAGTTKVSATGGVGRMTDASQYTGSHKERFDKDGKGKGIEGRADTADNSGYVGAYKGDGTYKGEK